MLSKKVAFSFTVVSVVSRSIGLADTPTRRQMQAEIAEEKWNTLVRKTYIQLALVHAYDRKFNHFNILDPVRKGRLLQMTFSNAFSGKKRDDI